MHIKYSNMQLRPCIMLCVTVRVVNYVTYFLNCNVCTSSLSHAKYIWLQLFCFLHVFWFTSMITSKMNYYTLLHCTNIKLLISVYEKGFLNIDWEVVGITQLRFPKVESSLKEIIQYKHPRLSGNRTPRPKIKWQY